MSTLHEWRPWNFDPTRAVGRHNQPAPADVDEACGDCKRPRVDHPYDRRIGQIRRTLSDLDRAGVPHSALAPIYTWASDELVGWTSHHIGPSSDTPENPSQGQDSEAK